MNKRIRKKREQGYMDWYLRSSLRNIFINIFKMKYSRAIGRGKDFGTQPMSFPRHNIDLPCYPRFKTFKGLKHRDISKRRRRCE